ncbi:CAP domain-containing protein [Virgibacillus sp. 179-BFC.A HS]|uniref:CAP domain-containing protein n=1 Tax=Tigheibacillus jepli TaxID=3035914 RepID=A0ABU5CKG6_9BACI|nr:CAP domain-containing protein [Virgibacillus sp. 179-BFC.A HS]MDY0406851.1 CAP domain-containing protein [Virgibacillus sp. 179-BFC.A HS]
MFKKITTVAVLSSAILFGAGFHSVDAAASNQSQNHSYKVYYSINGGNFQSADNFDPSYLNKYFSCLDTSKFQNNRTEQTKQPAKQHESVDKAGQQEQAKTQQPAKQQPAENASQDKAAQNNQSSSNKVQGLSEYEQQVVDLTNQERAKQGLKPLKADLELSRVAREKSHDMAVNGYFSHNSPTYGSPFDMMKSYGIKYNTAGENIAKGQKTPQEVVNAWMNSEGHRANILNPNFTKIGVGYSAQGNIWTQQFIG